MLLAATISGKAVETVKLVYGASMDITIPENPNGQMVLICPGGAYCFLCTDYEGSFVSEWLAQRGIASAVVKYALPKARPEVPLLCVQDAMVYCRKHSGQWGVSSIGVMGFSAGGHLAATVATHFVSPETRPDFAALIYPVITMYPPYAHEYSRDNLIGEYAIWDDAEEELALTVAFYSIELCVNEDTPPTFLAHCKDDGAVPPQNSELYCNAMRNYNRPCEHHVYPAGGHGFGFFPLGIENDSFPYRAQFYNDFENWLKSLENK